MLLLQFAHFLDPKRLAFLSACRRDIKRLWKVAGQRYTAPKQQIAAAVGPDYSLWHVSLLRLHCGIMRLCAGGISCVTAALMVPACQCGARHCLSHALAPRHPSIKPLQDLPASISQLSHFRGKAALPTHVLGISSFSKAFFLHPDTVVGWGRLLRGTWHAACLSTA